MISSRWAWGVTGQKHRADWLVEPGWEVRGGVMRALDPSQHTGHPRLAAKLFRAVDVPPHRQRGSDALGLTRLPEILFLSLRCRTGRPMRQRNRCVRVRQRAKRVRRVKNASIVGGEFHKPSSSRTSSISAFTLSRAISFAARSTRIAFAASARASTSA